MASVQDLLDLPVLQRARPEIFSGDPNRTVRWVHTSEIFDIGSLLEGGELLLTTGLGLVRESEPRMREYVSRIAEHGAAGLILELGRTFPEPPEAMLDEAIQRGLLFGVLHDVVPWVQVTEAAHRLIVDEDAVSLRDAHDLGRALMGQVLDCDSSEALLSAISDLTGWAVALEESSDLVTWSGNTRDLDSTSVRLALPSTGEAGPVLILPSSTPRESRDVIAEVVSLWHTLRDRRDSTTIPEGGSRLATVISAAPNLDSRHRRILVDLGLEPQRSQPTHAFTLVVRSGPVDAHGIERHARQLFRNVVAVPVEGAIIVLARGKLRADNDNVEVLTPLVAHLREGGSDVTVIEGEPQSSLTGLGRELDDLLLLAANPQVRRTSQLHIARYETNLLRLLSHLDDVGRTESFVHRELGPILAHDAAHRPPLMPTLVALLTSKSKVAAARQLGISRQAMHARIAIVEDMMDIADEAPLARRAAVTLAALIWQWRNQSSL